MKIPIKIFLAIQLAVAIGMGQAWGASKPHTVNVKYFNESSHKEEFSEIKFYENETVLNLKQKIEFLTGIPAEYQHLEPYGSFYGFPKYIIDDNRPLSEFNLENERYIYVFDQRKRTGQRKTEEVKKSTVAPVPQVDFDSVSHRFWEIDKEVKQIISSISPYLREHEKIETLKQKYNKIFDKFRKLVTQYHEQGKKLNLLSKMETLLEKMESIKKEFPGLIELSAETDVLQKITSNTSGLEVFSDDNFDSTGINLQAIAQNFVRNSTKANTQNFNKHSDRTMKFTSSNLATGEDFTREIYVPKIYSQIKKIPTKAKIIFIGDIHGDLDALIKIIKDWQRLGYINTNFITEQNTYFVFIGDYSDYGKYSKAVLASVFSLKNINQNNVFLLRGNHDYPVNFGQVKGLSTRINNDENLAIQITDELVPELFFITSDKSVISASHALPPSHIDESCDFNNEDDRFVQNSHMYADSGGFNPVIGNAMSYIDTYPLQTFMQEVNNLFIKNKIKISFIGHAHVRSGNVLYEIDKIINTGTLLDSIATDISDTNQNYICILNTSNHKLDKDLGYCYAVLTLGNSRTEWNLSFHTAPGKATSETQPAPVPSEEKSTVTRVLGGIAYPDDVQNIRVQKAHASKTGNWALDIELKTYRPGDIIVYADYDLENNFYGKVVSVDKYSVTAETGPGGEVTKIDISFIVGKITQPVKK